MKTWAAAVCMLGALLTPQGRKAPGDDVPILPRASLLVGTPPFFLMVTNAHESLRLQPEYSQPETRDGTSIYPSISRDGKVIAYARLKAAQPQRIVAISTYSALEDKHADYSEGEYAGAVAISPDASKLAYVAGGRDETHRIHIIDLATKRETIGPEAGYLSRPGASWSPDSRRLAYNFNREIRIWDADTDKIAKVAVGGVPAWAPSGEWIAYFDSFPYERSTRCMIVHPDGTGEKTLFNFPKKRFQRFLVEAPLWSPDSKTILLNELADVDTGTVDIHLLDLQTLKLKTVVKDTLRVLGWAEAQ